MKKTKAKEIPKDFKELEPIKVNVAEQNRYDMTQYALYVLGNRTIANLYGFKPVQLRLLYCMFKDLNATGHTVKCASIVGRVLEKYHPHGDTAAYGALQPIANWYDCYMPLVTKQGNFGSFQGDSAAHYRYTEARVSDFAMDCIIGELKETDQVVDWEKNYSESCMQPVYLPIKVPILLINGTSGIGTGVKTDIPSHNFNEVLDATMKLIKNPNAQITLTPDMCMPCEILDTNWKAISNTGSGNFVIRSKIETGEYKGHPTLVIRSLPNECRLEPVKKAIETLKLNNEIPQVIDILEDCTPTDLKCIIVLKKGSDTNYVKQVLYKKTSLQQTGRVNFEVYDPVNCKLVRLSYKGYLQFFIDFRKATKFRYYCGKYQNIATRLHAVKMYIEIMKNDKIDEIINTLRHNKKRNDAELIEYFITKYKLTDVQSIFIVNNNLKKISPLYLEKYIEEASKLEEDAKFYYNKIVNEDEVTQDIYDELQAIKKKYWSERRCRVINKAEASCIPEGEFKIIITENNFIRKIMLTDSMGNFKDDKPKFIMKVQNTSNVIIFDDKGKAYKLQVSKLPIYDKRSNGIDVRILIKNLTSNIIAAVPEDTITKFSKKITNKFFLVCASRKGFIKKLDLEDFLAVPVNGFFYMKLEQDDTVQDIMIIPDTSDIIVYSDTKALRFQMHEVPLLKRATKGNIAMKSDYIDGISVIRSDTTDIIVITVSGYVNRFNVTGFDRSGRAKAGSRVIKLHKGDAIKFIYGVNIDDELNIITNSGSKKLNVSELKEGSSISIGEKLIPTRDILLKCLIAKKKNDAE